MVESIEFSITKASQLTIPNKDWTHYRSGLKLRCSSGSLGVTLAIISQGKSIDSTMITSFNVRFLSKEPIVGLKIFDGEKLRKRLQITFSSEGDFNMFANKINSWTGLSVISKFEASDSQLANSQLGSAGPSLSQTRQFSSSQVAPGQLPDSQKQSFGSQTQGSQSIDSSFAPSQNAFLELTTSQIANSQDSICQPFIKKEDSQHLSGLRNWNDSYISSQGQASGCLSADPNEKPQEFDALQMLMNAAKNESMRLPPQVDTSMISQSTSLWNENSRDSILSYPQATAYNTSYVQVANGGNDIGTYQDRTCQSEKAASRTNITQALHGIPFKPSRKNGKSKSSKFKSKHCMDDLLETTFSRLLEEKQESYLNLNDQDLSLKICRKLKSKSFLTLLKRIEGLLDEEEFN